MEMARRYQGLGASTLSIVFLSAENRPRNSVAERNQVEPVLTTAIQFVHPAVQ